VLPVQPTPAEVAVAVVAQAQITQVVQVVQVLLLSPTQIQLNAELAARSQVPVRAHQQFGCIHSLAAAHTQLEVKHE
jgi:hypothetical protein